MALEQKNAGKNEITCWPFINPPHKQLGVFRFFSLNNREPQSKWHLNKENCSKKKSLLIYAHLCFKRLGVLRKNIVFLARLSIWLL